MTHQPAITASDLYAKIVDGVVADPTIEAALLDDFNGTVAERFGVTLPSPGKLVRNDAGFRLSYAGQDFDLGDPRQAKPGELNDAELELVSAGNGNGCPQSNSDPNANRTAEGAMQYITRV